ncbi:hypothetical protein C8T65DRAFT_788061 [Cerioporus squamosus]|nr:hypothetical protein C8T65DRAFT_788061 [Cerioporus squamosus]
MGNKKNQAKREQGKTVDTVKKVPKPRKGKKDSASATSTVPDKPKPKARPRTAEQKKQFQEEYEAAELLVSLSATQAHGAPGPVSAGDSILDSNILAAMSQIIGASEDVKHLQEKARKVAEEGDRKEEGEEDEDTSDDSLDESGGEETEPQATVETVPAKMVKKTKAKGKYYVRASSSDEENSEPETYDISFKVPCGQAQREVTIPSSATWTRARSIIAEAMDREPSLLRLGYYALPWDKQQKATTATLLQKDLEWERLTGKVVQYVQSEKAKNRGHGVVKPFTITLVSVGDHGAAAGSVSNML